MEQFGADRELAIMAGAPGGTGQSTPLAKAATAGKDDAGSGSSRDERSFGGDWYTSTSAQTSRKIAGLACRADSHQADALRSDQKAVSTGDSSQERCANAYFQIGLILIR